jgi:glyoxylase-like metal-dependent hydrolase (beta-lactamase superfamily II)
MSDDHLAAATTLITRTQAPDGMPAASAAPAVQTFFDEATNTASHVVYDPATMRGAIIDPVLDFDQASGRTETRSADAIIAYVRAKTINIDWLLETHAHADHLSAAPYLQRHLGGKLGIGREIITVQNVFGKIFNAGTEFARDGSEFDRLFADGDRFALGNIDAIALHLPGHTPADMAYIIGDAVFTGDTLFMPDYGTARTDFPGGCARDLYRSIRRLLSLPDSSRLFLCHDYRTATRQHYEWETTVGEERRRNIHAHDGVAEDDFVAMRQARDATLATPRLLLPAVQVNMRAGHLPPAEENGTTYLKVPINLL